jgi:putative transcriptional regulator
VTKRAKKPGRLDRELEEMGRALHRLGGLSDDEFAKITLRDVTLEKLDRTGPPSPREIVAIREGARMNQAVFARLLDVSTGTLSKWERGELKPRGPAGRLLRIIRRKGIEAVLCPGGERTSRATFAICTIRA